jgi:hypothetical protein
VDWFFRPSSDCADWEGQLWGEFFLAAVAFCLVRKDELDLAEVPGGSGVYCWQVQADADLVHEGSVVDGGGTGLRCCPGP